MTLVSSTGEQVSSSPFSSSSCPTYGKDNSALLSAGYIDSTGNLVAAHDAATAHLGSPWRMPTGAEIDALVSNCTSMFMTTNGVRGYLFTGKGAYANRSIFLPEAGYNVEFNFYYEMNFPTSPFFYWSSMPGSNDSGAWCLSYYYGDYSIEWGRYIRTRYYGQPVRPVRGSAQ